MNVLTHILEQKRREVAAAKLTRPMVELEAAALALPPPRDLVAALRRPPGQPIRVLAEIKRASPSAGPIRPGADPALVATAYSAGGAAALSVLTDRTFFDGDLAFIAAARAAVSLPVLRKDFLVDPYQVVEARAAGADAILLIVAALDRSALRDMLQLAGEIGMAALVEVHDRAEAEAAVAVGAALIGVNHRDLTSLTIDMGLTAALLPLLPPGTVAVAESGIRTASDVAALADAGAHAILVGEVLMRASSPGDALRALVAPR